MMLVAERTNNDYFRSFLPTVNSPPHRDITGVAATSYRSYNDDYASVQRQIDRPLPELENERSKKEKKWSLGKLFRRKKKEEESGTSSQSDEGVSERSPSKRKSKKKNRVPAVNNFDHIVIRDTRRAQSLANHSVRDITDDGILSDPSAGFLNYQPRSRDIHDGHQDYLVVSDVNKNRSEKIHLEIPHKKNRKSRLKARVEALRNSLKGESSSDEESLKSSNSSSMIRFRSDDSLMRSRESSLNKRSRSARNERYIKRLSRDDENQLNKEAELLQQGYSKAEVEMLTRTPTSQSSGYGTCKREPANNLQTEHTVANDIIRRSVKSESVSSFPSTQSYPSSINFNAKVNNEHISYSIKYPNNNIKHDTHYANNTRERTPSSNQYENPDNIMCVKFPLGNVSNITEEKAPPVPPPRDMHRKVVTPISMYYENNSVNGNRTNVNQNVLHGVHNNDFERLMRRSQERTTGSGFNGLRRPLSNSEDHIAMQNNDYLQSSNYRNEQPRRPASVSAEPNHYGMYMNSPSWKKRLEQNKIMRPEPIQIKQEYLYYADQSPRSRRPISIQTSHNGIENQYLSDSQASSNMMENAYRRPRNASEFWKKIDDAEKQRKQQMFANLRAKSEYSTPANLNNIFLDQNKTKEISNSRNEPRNIITSNMTKAPESKQLKAGMEYKRSVTVDVPESSSSTVLKTHTRHKSDTFIQNTQVPSDDENSERRKSTNLDDALNELEAIYNSLGLGDEDLLDRAERRELMSPKLNVRCNDWNGNDDDIELRCQPTTPLRRISRRSTLPDKLQDDMAFRRMNSFSNKEKPNYIESQAQISYMLASPVYVPYASDDDRQSERNEPNIIYDDVVYRNIKQTNSRLKTVDPQPPFGIPVGPVSPAPQSDYLHATPENKERSRFIPKKSPDLVADDLAYRSLRKDNRHSALFSGDEYNGIVNTNYTEFPFTNDPGNNKKKKRAVRSLSANIFTVVQKEIDDAINMSKTTRLQKTHSNSDVMRRLRETFEKSDTQRDFYPRNKVKQRHNTVNLFVNNTHSPIHHFAKDDSFVHNENKCLARSSPCDKSTTSSPSNKSPQTCKRSSKDEFQQVLSMLAQEAMDTSNKLGVALAELDKNRNKNELSQTQNRISDSRTNFLNALTDCSNDNTVPENESREINLNNCNIQKVPNDDVDSKAKKTEESLLKISNQLHKVEDQLKHSYEKEINFEDESSRLSVYTNESEKRFKVNETTVVGDKQSIPDVVPVSIQNDTKNIEINIEKEFKSNPDFPHLKFHPSNPFLCSDDKLNEINEMRAFKELKDGISDLIAGISEVNDKIFISKNAQKSTEVRVMEGDVVPLVETDIIKKDIPAGGSVNWSIYENNDFEEKKDDAESAEYNSSEELATIFKFDNKRLNKQSNAMNSNDNSNSAEEERTDLNSPKLVRTMNQQLRRLSVDESIASQSDSLPNNVVPWRAKRQNHNSQNVEKGDSTKSKHNWHNSGTLMLACSYTLMLSQQLADLDWLMLLGLLLAMITIIAMLLI